MKVLVGNTGFVGSNIYAKGSFDAAYHSKNITEAYGTGPDLLIYAGMRAEKYLANHAPGEDLGQVMQAERNIEKIRPKKLVLISTIDVFRVPIGVDETAEVDTEGLHAYGHNRYQLELWARERYPDALIIRLPALFGENIKKNFIYDLIHVIPAMLTGRKFAELSAADPGLGDFYSLQENGYYKVRGLADGEEEALKSRFRKLGFTALSFTDSRSSYQFYNLGRLWDDIQAALRAGLTLWHPATEPVSAAELCKYVTGEEFVNELPGIPAKYDCRTIYGDAFGGGGGYICDKGAVLRGVKQFIGRHCE